MPKNPVLMRLLRFYPGCYLWRRVCL